MLRAAIFATFVAIAAGQQGIQYTQPYKNVPLVFPQGQQSSPTPFGHYNDPYQGPYPYDPYDCFNLDIFKQYQYILVVDNKNQPLGYIYSANKDPVLQKQNNFLPVIDSNGNILAYYSTYIYKPGDQFQPQDLTENVISELAKFGIIYNGPNQGRPGFMLVKNPFVFYNSDNGVLRPNAYQNGKCKFEFPNNFFPNYYGQYPYPGYPAQCYYGPGYNVPYFPRYPGPYYQFCQYPYNRPPYLPHY